MIHIKNPDIVRTEQFIQAFSGLFRDIQYVFRHIEA